MTKVFLDSSILVAACASKTGASALVLDYCRKKKISGFVSLETIGEARINVNLKLNPTQKKRFSYFLRFANLFLVPTPFVEEITKCEKVINHKDAPILAAALKSSASFLLTLDRKHFFKPEVIEFTKPLKIATPGDFVFAFKKIPLDI